ncbi:hypothetical protein ACFL6H_00040 [Candidatus Latescibacterota bacterium]
MIDFSWEDSIIKSLNENVSQRNRYLKQLEDRLGRIDFHNIATEKQIASLK